MILEFGDQNFFINMLHLVPNTFTLTESYSGLEHSDMRESVRKRLMDNKRITTITANVIDAHPYETSGWTREGDLYLLVKPRIEQNGTIEMIVDNSDIVSLLKCFESSNIKNFRPNLCVYAYDYGDIVRPPAVLGLSKLKIKF